MKTMKKIVRFFFFAVAVIEGTNLNTPENSTLPEMEVIETCEQNSNQVYDGSANNDEENYGFCPIIFDESLSDCEKVARVISDLKGPITSNHRPSQNDSRLVDLCRKGSLMEILDKLRQCCKLGEGRCGEQALKIVFRPKPGDFDLADAQ